MFTRFVRGEKKRTDVAMKGVFLSELSSRVGREKFFFSSKFVRRLDDSRQNVVDQALKFVSTVFVVVRRLFVSLRLTSLVERFQIQTIEFFGTIGDQIAQQFVPRLRVRRARSSIKLLLEHERHFERTRPVFLRRFVTKVELFDLIIKLKRQIRKRTRVYRV